MGFRRLVCVKNKDFLSRQFNNVLWECLSSFCSCARVSEGLLGFGFVVDKPVYVWRVCVCVCEFARGVWRVLD